MANKKLYVGNLSWGTTEDGLKNLFSEYGQVVSAQIIIDRETDRSKGFGFVEMGSEDEAESAQKALNDYEFEGRKLRVNEANSKKEGGGPRGRRDR